MMPIDLILVRHGESEGNIANKHSKQGDDSLFTEAFKGRHSSTWRLTDKGIEQAIGAGTWIREHLQEPFDRYYVSEYARAKETAAYLKLLHAKWYAEYYLRERDWGDLDVLSLGERNERFQESLKKREADSFFWTPPNGESLATMCMRVDRVLDTLHRECSDKRVIMVCHGEVMWGFRIRLERLSQKQFKELDSSHNPFDKIHNCQILHYTRRDPDTGELSPHLTHMRSINPHDMSLSKNEWTTITRTSFSNEDLLSDVERIEREIS